MKWAWLLAAVIAATAPTTVSKAGTWTAPLTFRTVTTPDGQHLAAEFDLGVQLRRIDRAEVTLTLPDGFSGGVAATSNSFYENSLAVAVGGADAVGLVNSLRAPGVSSCNDDGCITPLSTGRFSIPAGQPVALTVVERAFKYTGPLAPLAIDTPFLIDSGWPSVLPFELPPTPWPDSLFAGRGQVGIAHFSSASTRWLQPDGSRLPGPSSHNLRLPTSPVIHASVTITGIAVPEPGAGWLLVVGSLLATRRRAGESRE